MLVSLEAQIGAKDNLILFPHGCSDELCMIWIIIASSTYNCLKKY